MEFALVQYVDTKSNLKSVLVNEISSKLENYLKNRDYGASIDTYLIGFLCVKTIPGYEDWYKAKKPRYVDYKKVKNRITGEMMEIVKKYGYDIKFDYELYDEFVDSSDEESKKLLARKILESFAYLDKLPKKVVDFDKEMFKSDVEQFFKEQDLL